jgi:hypothetical protein
MRKTKNQKIRSPSLFKRKKKLKLTTLIPQDLQGFNRANTPFPLTDRRRLSEMNLPKENFLYLINNGPEVEAVNGDSNMYAIITHSRTSPTVVKCNASAVEINKTTNT